jgi:hypothetical protein
MLPAIPGQENDDMCAKAARQGPDLGTFTAELDRLDHG